MVKTQQCTCNGTCNNVLYVEKPIVLRPDLALALRRMLGHAPIRQLLDAVKMPVHNEQPHITARLDTLLSKCVDEHGDLRTSVLIQLLSMLDGD